MYVVIQTNNERNTVLLGAPSSKEKAQKIMRDDFERWFWEKYQSESDKSFAEVYAKYEGDECEIREDSAWLNSCNQVDFGWDIFELLPEEDDYEEDFLKDYEEDDDFDCDTCEKREDFLSQEEEIFDDYEDDFWKEDD